MSTIIARVKEIQTHENINIIKFEIDSNTLTMMSLDISNEIKVGKKVRLLVNSSHIAVAKGFGGDISYSNQIDAKIETLKQGELLTHISLVFGESTLESIITKESSLSMKLSEGDNVTVLIKASELSICEILDD